MKVKFLKSFLLAGCLLFAGIAGAQSYLEDPKYGNDPESRERNVLILNLFNDAFKANQLDVAAGYLQHLLKEAPKASQNVYINGANIYKNKISRAGTDREARQLYVDSLMLLYDLRAENFGDNATRGYAYILGQKALDYNRYLPANTNQSIEAFQKAIEAGQEKTDPAVIATYYKVITDGFLANAVETDLVIDEYDRLLSLLTKSADAKANDIKGNIEALFIQSGAASCENLERIFKPQFEANPTDTELMGKILNLLARAQCNSPFQRILAEKYYEVEPSAAAAISLAYAFESEGDLEKALAYYDNAISLETDNEQKEKYMLIAAGASLETRNNRKAADYARQVLSINPNSGTAYLILANAYAGGASSACSTFDAQTVFWLAVDQLAKARELSDSSQLESINRQIGQFSANFPSKEECFFRTLNNGEGYTVNCGWISGRTTVRAR